MTKRVTTYRERRQMEDLIMANSTPIDGNEIDRQWADDWDARRVAQQCPEGVTVDHVRSFIRGTLGITVRTLNAAEVSKKLEHAALLDRIAALETRLETLEQWCYSNEIPSNVTKLKGA